MSTLAGLGVLTCLFILPARGEADGPVLWDAEFSQLETGAAPEFGVNVTIREEGGVKVLSKADSETEFLFARDAAKSGSDGWMDYVLKVRFREPEKSTVALVVKAKGRRDEVPYMHYYVGIREKEIGLLCHGIPKDQAASLAGDPRVEAKISYEDLGASPLPVGEWITAEVSVGEEVIKVSVDCGDQQPRVAEFKVFPGSGGVSVLTRSPIDVRAISVREAGRAVVAKP